MKQYCRYCAFCIESEPFYCTLRNELLSDKQIKRINHCSEFALSEMGDVITGKQYQPREPKTEIQTWTQLSLEQG